MLPTTPKINYAVLVELLQKREIGLLVVSTVLTISILKSAALEELFLVLDMGVAETLSTTRRHSCVALVELFQKREVDPHVAGTLLLTLILKSAAPSV